VGGHKIRQSPLAHEPRSGEAEFVEPEVISRIVVDQYAGPTDDVRRYLSAMPGAAAQNFGLSLKLCAPPPRVYGTPPAVGARLDWTSTSTVTFESGRSGRLAVVSVIVSNAPLFRSKVFGLSDAPGCIGFDKVPVDSLYVSYIDPEVTVGPSRSRCRRRSRCPEVRTRISSRREIERS
jgi:hypothetical protein